MHSTRVVIIEDEFFAAAHLRDSINSLGFNVVEVYHSGEDFLDNTDWVFDVVVIDIFLSAQLSGLDVAQKMREEAKPFIFLTSNQDARTMERALSLHPLAYINKPFKINEVATALEEIVL